MQSKSKVPMDSIKKNLFQIAFQVIDSLKTTKTKLEVTGTKINKIKFRISYDGSKNI